jgi:hypothetical protein
MDELLSPYFINENITFEPLETNDSRINRNFESLIMERNEIHDDKGIYSQIFKEIKDKIFSVNEIEDIPKLTDIQKEELNKKHFVDNFSNTINNIKKLLVNNFNRKLELEFVLEGNKKKFEAFTKNINDSISSINNIIDNEMSSEDENLKELLSNRINWYYSKLNIESLKKEYSEILFEYSFFKDMLKSISEVLPSGTCGICLDNQVNWFIDPCGHSICNGCKNKFGLLTKCHFCRTTITSIKKLYI